MKIVAAIAAAAAVVSLAPVAEAACYRAGGEATMLTEDLAKFMASAALKNQIAANGWKPTGEASMKCEASSFGGIYCIAQQKACK